ncbi:MAG: hypothetical protein K8S87_08500 [Planctomycetes bacterium]|nr:hypothetical protein [Planctomycetota bacterium]
MKFSLFKHSKFPLFRKVSHPIKTRWANRGIYIFLGVGVTTALNLWWRFPAYSLKYNGGSFLIAYLIAIVLTVLPLLIYESALGQRSQRAMIRTVQQMNKKNSWFGYWVLILSSIVALYMMIVFCWSILFTGESLQSLFKVSKELPWAKDSASFMLSMCYQNASQTWSLPSWGVIYFLVFFWIVIPGIAVRGGHSIGAILKPVFFIGLLLQFVVVIRFLGFGMFTLDGGVFGLSWALHPDWSQLNNFNLWIDAFTLAIFGAGLGLGLHIASASLLPRENDITNNSLFIVITSFFLLFLMFLASASLLGGQALHDGRTLNNVAEHFRDVQPEGIGTFFLVFPRAISDVLPDSTTGKALISFSLFGSFACFTMIFIMMLINSIQSILRELKGWGKRDTAIFIGFFGFIITFVLSGITNWHWIDDIDKLILGIGVIFAVLVQCFIPGWLIGTNDLRNYVNEHSEIKTGFLWELIMKVFLPISLTIIFIYNFLNIRFDSILTSNNWLHRGIILTFVLLMLILSILFARNRKSSRTSSL